MKRVNTQEDMGDYLVDSAETSLKLGTRARGKCSTSIATPLNHYNKIDDYAET